MPPFSAASPFTASVLILRGSLFGIVPFAAVASAGAGGRNARNLRRVAVLVQRRKYHARRAGPGIDVNRRFLARHQLFAAVARRHAVRGLGGGTIGLGRHHLGRAVVGPDDRRLAAAGRADIGAIGKGSARPHHGQRQHGGNRHQPARALLRRGLFVVAVLIGVRIVRIGRIALIVLFAGFDPAVERIVVTRRILLRLGGGILRRLVIVLRRRLRLLGRVTLRLLR